MANDDPAAVNQNQATAINVLGNDTDADGDTLSVSAVTQGAHGTVTNNGTNVTFSPTTAYCGADSSPTRRTTATVARIPPAST